MAASILNPYVKRSVKVKSLNDITTKERFSPLTANLMSKSRVFPHLGFPDAVPAAELAANGDYPQIPACLVLLWHQQPPRCWCQACLHRVAEEPSTAHPWERVPIVQAVVCTQEESQGSCQGQDTHTPCRPPGAPAGLRFHLGLCGHPWDCSVNADVTLRAES